MRALLVTLQGVNIGNRLQNYALQTVLQKNSCEVFTPVYRVKQLSFKENIKIKVKAFLGKTGIRRYYNYYVTEGRRRKFKSFDRAYIYNRFYVDFSLSNRNLVNYDIVFTGSDQVWHKWTKDDRELPYFYLEFADKIKRIAYAPSFGFESFPSEDLYAHINGLKGLAMVSAREQSGKELIESILNCEIPLVLDPTLLLTPDDWNMIKAKPNYFVPDKYILVYFLGGKNEDYQRFIINESKRLSAEVIDVFDMHMKNYYFTRPDEFIWLVEHTELVLTDSFHACVFSIIFHRRFIPFHRIEEGFQNMYGRIESLLLTCGINENTLKSNSDIDWNEIDSLLLIEQKKSLGYIRKAINSCKE